jgi:transposase
MVDGEGSVKLRLPNDLTDAEWTVLEPLLSPRSHRGRPPVWSYREIVGALLYLLRGGLPWRVAKRVLERRGTEDTEEGSSRGLLSLCPLCLCVS